MVEGLVTAVVGQERPLATGIHRRNCSANVGRTPFLSSKHRSAYTASSTAAARSGFWTPTQSAVACRGTHWQRHYKCATLTAMKSCTLPAVRVEPELRAELESVLGKEETISTFVADAVRRAVDFRRVQTDFHARGEAAWQNYLRTGVSHPVDEVFDRVQARIDARRRELQSPSM